MARAVGVSLWRISASGVPSNSTFPPALPAPRPISITQSAWPMKRRLCSMTMIVSPLLVMSLRRSAICYRILDSCSPLVGSSKIRVS